MEVDEAKKIVARRKEEGESEAGVMQEAMGEGVKSPGAWRGNDKLMIVVNRLLSISLLYIDSATTALRLNSAKPFP